jgi:putative MFS transporter
MEQSEFTPFMRRLTIFCSGGPFLDGYILVIIAAALVQLEPELGLNPFWMGLLGTASLVGLFVGGALFGYLTDRIGRKRMYTYDLLAIVILSIGQLFVQDAVQLVVMRFLIGIAVGADYPIATSLLAEFSPKKYRGRMLGLLMLMWYIGAMVANVVGYFLLDVSGGWKWMLGSAAIPAIILIIGRWGTPESPRWLVSKNKFDEALKVVKQVYGSNADLSDIEQAPAQTKISKFLEPIYIKRLALVGGFWLCEMVPLYAIYTFGPKILEMFGITGGSAKSGMIGELVLSAMFLLGILPAIKLVDTAGRRPLIIWSFVIMTAGMAMLAIFAGAPAWVILIGFAMFTIASGGPSVLQWIYPNELFPTEIRASAVGLATSISRIGACAGTFGLPMCLESFGLVTTMWVMTGVSALGVIICITLAVETKSLTLAEAGGGISSNAQ